MAEGSEMSGDSSQTQQMSGHKEHELVFVLIMVGLLGIGLFFVFIYFGSSNHFVPSSTPSANETMTSFNYSDVEGRNQNTLGLAIGKDIGRYYTHPESTMTLYVLTTGECSGECLSTWQPYLSNNVGADDPLLGVVVRSDTGESQYTLNGRGLYTYNQDQFPGDIMGSGVNDVWQIARP